MCRNGTEPLHQRVKNIVSTELGTVCTNRFTTDHMTKNFYDSHPVVLLRYSSLLICPSNTTEILSCLF
jgi:hypothetical protein